MNRYSVNLFMFLLFSFVLSPGEAKGEKNSNLFSKLTTRIAETWESDNYDFYLPVHTWHNRLMYDSSYRKERAYNEQPWGFGFGRGFKDENGNSHGLYLMGFMDSNNYFQAIGGYNFVKNWYLDEQKDWSVGLGYTLSITARHEYDYIPLPLPLPVFSMRHKQLAVQAAYVPGTRNDGNVLFTWLRWHMD
jgi:palmitoyl transferase